MKKVIPLFLGALAGCAGESALPTSPAAFAPAEVTHTTLREPINTATFTFANPCTGEDIVNAVGTGHLSRTTIVKDGSTRTVGSINFQNVVGVGELSGREYRLASNTHFVQEFDVSEGGSFQLRLVFRGITGGPDDNLFVETLTEISFPLGQPVVVVTQTTSECRG